MPAVLGRPLRRVPIGRPAVDDDVVARGREPPADLFDAGLEPAVARRDAARARPSLCARRRPARSDRWRGIQPLIARNPDTCSPPPRENQVRAADLEELACYPAFGPLLARVRLTIRPPAPARRPRGPAVIAGLVLAPASGAASARRASAWASLPNRRPVGDDLPDCVGDLGPAPTARPSATAVVALGRLGQAADAGSRPRARPRAAPRRPCCRTVRRSATGRAGRRPRRGGARCPARSRGTARSRRGRRRPPASAGRPRRTRSPGRPRRGCRGAPTCRASRSNRTASMASPVPLRSDRRPT